jgi:hypothetical protein
MTQTAMAQRIELRSIRELAPYAKNPRTHSDEQVDQIGASIIEFGFNNPRTFLGVYQPRQSRRCQGKYSSRLLLQLPTSRCQRPFGASSSSSIPWHGIIAIGALARLGRSSSSILSEDNSPLPSVRT